MAEGRHYIDWNAFRSAHSNGKFIDLLLSLPRDSWYERNGWNGYTLLQNACVGPNVSAVVALLLFCDPAYINICNAFGHTAAHFAAANAQPRILEILCARGADVQYYNDIVCGVIEFALNSNCESCVRVLLANGVRLSNVKSSYRDLITDELKKFEQGVLRCRKAVVALIRLKKAAQLWYVDKYLLREIGFAIWATRCDEKWQL